MRSLKSESRSRRDAKARFSKRFMQRNLRRLTVLLMARSFRRLRRFTVINSLVYCLSYTTAAPVFLPFGSVVVVVTVRVLPFAEMTARPVKVTLVPCLAVNVNVWALTCLYDRESEVGSPVTG